jgi:hypothetical protein
MTIASRILKNQIKTVWKNKAKQILGDFAELGKNILNI